VGHKLVCVSGIDWILLTIYFVFVLGVGAALPRFTQASTDFVVAAGERPVAR
jgi:hypothetical protein